MSNTIDTTAQVLHHRNGDGEAFSTAVAATTAAGKDDQETESAAVLAGDSAAVFDKAALPSNLVKLGIVLGVGSVQGFLLALSGMFSPRTFRSQMRLETFVLMKIFFSAMGSSMITQSLVFDTMLPKEWNYVRGYRFVAMGMKRVGVGCAMIGVGLATAGSGPSMVGVQLASGTRSAWYCLAGFLGGVGIYHFVEPRYFQFPCVAWRGEQQKTVIDDYINGFITVDLDGNVTADAQKKGYIRYRTIALPFGLALLAASVGLEKVFPHRLDLERLGFGSLVASARSPMAMVVPTMAGAFIGLNQISTRYITGDGQGGSRALAGIVANLTRGKIGDRFKMDSFGSHWQFLHVYGATAIGALAAAAAMNRYTAAEGLPSFTAVTAAGSGFGATVTVVGAAIAGFGARLAGGCTCGHGVSGASELAVQSLLGAGIMFATGIATAGLLGLRA